MPERFVFHLDMDAFFAAIEVLANPSLRGRPLVVGGNPEDRGVVSTASYEARAFGIRSGMPLAEAHRLCPRAIFIPCRPEPYVYFSTRMLKLLLARTPRVELFSIDEAFIEGSDLCRDRESAIAWARDVSAQVARELKLTGSFGIGPNKLIAKMASKLEKPRGVTFLSRADFREVFWGRPLESLFGVGERTAKAMMELGLVTIGDLARTEPSTLRPYFGVVGPMLVAAANGMDESPVVPYGEEPPAKSIGHEHTFQRDQRDRAEISRLLSALADQVGFALRQERRLCQTVHLKIRWSDWTTITRQTTLREPIDSSERIFRHALQLFQRFDLGGEVRLLGVSVSSLSEPDVPAMTPLFPRDQSVEKMEQATDRLRERYGFQVLRRASALPGKMSQ